MLLSRGPSRTCQGLRGEGAVVGVPVSAPFGPQLGQQPDQLIPLVRGQALRLAAVPRGLSCPSVPAPIPSSRAISATGLRVSRTIRTAPALNSGSYLRRISDNNTELRVVVGQIWYTSATPHKQDIYLEPVFFLGSYDEWKSHNLVSHRLSLLSVGCLIQYENVVWVQIAPGVRELIATNQQID